MLKGIRDWIASKDEIVEPSALKLHFNQDYKIKTFVGGCFSLIIQGIVVYIVISHFYTMINRGAPTMYSVVDKIDDDLEVPFVNVSKTIF